MIRQVGEIRICALVPYPKDTTPSQRFRIEQWKPFLESEGISIDLLPFIDSRLMGYLHKPGFMLNKVAGMKKALIRRVWELGIIRHYDLVLIHRTACLFGPAVIECIIALLGKPLLFDFDDAIFVLDVSAANRRFGWLKFPGKTGTICRLSSHVIAGCEYLADYARGYNSQVTVIPTSIDTDLYQPVLNKRQNPKIVIGWTGSATSQTHLEMFASMLKKISELRDVEIRVQSNREPLLPGLPINWRPWSPDSEIHEISEFDIGIKPMPDDPWARGKCPMKELQYMALGIPTVASNVGTSPEVIRHGQNGFLASNENEWLDCLTKLIDDKSLRHLLGEAGRKTVEDRYSMRHCASRFAEIVRQTVLEWQLKQGVSRRPGLNY